MAVRIAVQHSTAQHSTAQHGTAQHSTARHSTAQHSVPARRGRRLVRDRQLRPGGESSHQSQSVCAAEEAAREWGGGGELEDCTPGAGRTRLLPALYADSPSLRRGGGGGSDRVRAPSAGGGGSLRPVAVPKSPGIPCNRHPAPSDIRRSSLLPAYPPVAGYERSAVRRPALKGEGKKTPHPVRFLPSPVPVVWCGTRLATTSHDSTSPGRPPHPGFLAVRSTENARDSWKRGGHYPWARQSGLHGSAASQPSPAIAVSCRLQLTQHSQVGSSPARRRHRRTDRQRRVSARFTESDRERERERESKNLG